MVSHNSNEALPACTIISAHLLRHVHLAYCSFRPSLCAFIETTLFLLLASVHRERYVRKCTLAPSSNSRLSHISALLQLSLAKYIAMTLTIPLLLPRRMYRRRSYRAGVLDSIQGLRERSSVAATPGPTLSFAKTFQHRM